MKYQVLVKSFIDGRIYDPEQSETPIIIEYDGIPGSNLRAIDGKPPQKMGQKEYQARLKAAANTENPSNVTA